MKNDKEDTFKQLIQQAALEQPSAGFTESTMHLVRAEARQVVANEVAVQALFRRPGLIEKPSPDFSRRIMGEVLVFQAIEVEPIIPRRAWYLMAVSVVLMIVCCYLVVTPATTQSAPSVLESVLIGIMGQLETLPLLYPLTIVALSVLMLGDYYLRQRIGDILPVMQ